MLIRMWRHPQANEDVPAGVGSPPCPLDNTAPSHWVQGVSGPPMEGVTSLDPS